MDFKAHSDDPRLKIKMRNNILQKLTGTLWGVDAPTLCTADLAVVFLRLNIFAPSGSIVLMCQRYTKKLFDKLTSKLDNTFDILK